jgi:FtsH-binding integral membrane protein
VPSHLKLLLSVMICVVAAVMVWVERAGGAPAIGWVVVALGALMVLGIWLFPEARRHDKTPGGGASS